MASCVRTEPRGALSWARPPPQLRATSPGPTHTWCWASPAPSEPTGACFNGFEQETELGGRCNTQASCKAALMGLILHCLRSQLCSSLYFAPAGPSRPLARASSPAVLFSLTCPLDSWELSPSPPRPTPAALPHLANAEVGAERGTACVTEVSGKANAPGSCLPAAPQPPVPWKAASSVLPEAFSPIPCLPWLQTPAGFVQK